MTRLKTCSNDTAPINHYRATAENDRVVRLPWQPIFAYVPATRARYASIFSSSLALSLSLSLSLSLNLSRLSVDVDGRCASVGPRRSFQHRLISI